MPSTQRSPGGSSSGRAPRGSACLNCRRRKFKCDGARPICGPCIRSNCEFDCEYTDGPTRSPTQVLEDNISRLEARIYELEHPEIVTPSVTLYDPRSPPPVPGPSSVTAHQVPNMPIAGPSGGQPMLAAFFAPPQSVPTLAPNFGSEPSPEVIKMLIGHFLPRASQIGFFLHPARFIACATDPHAFALAPALFGAVCLWGARFSRDPAVRAHEPFFLQRAVHSVAAALAHPPTHTLVHAIQAEVLLANYFFTANRLLEGRYHCNAAVALVLSCRLNKLRAVPDPPAAAVTRGVELPPPADAVEEGERINAFWSVFVLDKSWAVVVGSPSHFDGPPGAQVDTPWPLDIEKYEHGGIPPGVQGSRTAEAFLAEVVPDGGSVSSLARLAKGAALFERATRLASQWTPAMVYIEQFAVDFFFLDSVIDQFVASLPPIEAAPTQADARTLLLTHTFALAATIRVHGTLKQAEGGTAQDRDVAAAHAAAAALDSIDLAQLAFADPILAILWTSVCRALIGEIARVRVLWTSALLRDGDTTAASETAETAAALGAAHDGHLSALQKVLDAMAVLASAAPLMAVQAAKIRQEFEGAPP
ncbi:uncharacterized protein LAESUDRAFT_755949 [Laetiporus sulphureus 93-53]|uniref:Zn(2)-C6 fungal-type domain-containing protein n=1 Tax=Laetiporus sulphureus 93-53 TaxID=1314785 RepID=A0A165GJK0_9APHY|nr:uncharacterized protein LAESUDRAFT_755949 [Laetiporus sulphureus 93-53]KZT10441.1 hypothetical protein LAESUDRAFT_755949 [Laetiporus sulphureus 93-53]